MAEQFKVGNKVVFTQAGRLFLETAGRTLQGYVAYGPKDGRYVVGTVTDLAADTVQVAVEGISGLGERYPLDAWYAACSACIRANVPAPLPPEPGRQMCRGHADQKTQQKQQERNGSKEKDGSTDTTGSAPVAQPGDSSTQEDTVATATKSKGKSKAAKKDKGEAKARKSQWDADAKIKVLVEENPKREGGKGHKQFAELMKMDGKTVGEFLALEGHRSALDGNKNWPSDELKWCIAKKFVKVGK